MEKLSEFFKALPDIIKNASQSPLGIIALLAIILGLLAWGFFREAPLRARLAIWLLILLGTTGFFVATVNASHSMSDSPTVSATTNTLAVTGTTVDAISNDSIKQAQITLVGRPESAVSDDNGNFRLELRTHGEAQADLRLRVTKVGYEPYDSQITAPANGFVVPLRRAQ
jgi:hypothetical protein